MVDNQIRALGVENIITNPKNSQLTYPLSFQAVSNVIVYGRLKNVLNFETPIPANVYGFNVDRSAIIFQSGFNLEAYSHILIKNPFPEIVDFFNITSLDNLSQDGKEFNDFNDQVVEWLRRLTDIMRDRLLMFETTLFKQVGLNNFPHISAGQVYCMNETEDGWIGVDWLNIKAELEKLYEEYKKKIEEYINKMLEEAIKKFEEYYKEKIDELNKIIEEFKKYLEEYKLELMKALCEYTGKLMGTLLYYCEQELKPMLKGWWDCFKADFDKYYEEKKDSLKGEPNVLTIGTVTKGEEASASITGESPAQVLNLVLPKGDKGNTGEKGDVGNTPMLRVNGNNIEVSRDNGSSWEILMDWSTTLKGDKGDPPLLRTDITSGYVQYSRDNGDTWENLIRLSDIQGEQGATGDKGDIPNEIVKVSEESDGIIFGMKYPDGTQLNFKIPYAEGTVGVTLGDEITHTLGTQPPENFIAYDNFKNLKESEYVPISAMVGSTTEFYWEQIKPDVDCYSFNESLGGGGTKVVEGALQSYIQALVQGNNSNNKWLSRYFRQVVSSGDTILPNTLFIMLKSSEITEILNNNEPVLIVAECTFSRQKYYADGSRIWGSFEHVRGGTDTYLHGGYKDVINQASSLETQRMNYDFYPDKISSYVLGTYFFNTLAWEKQMLESNTTNINNPEKDLTMLGLVIEFTSLVRDITFTNFRIFRRKRGTGEMYIDLPPFYFTPQYQDMAKQGNAQGDYAEASKELTYKLGIKKYIGNTR